ncbi:MAG: hypothetical protein AB1894_11240 [Chloroflexota bacterium]
MNVTPSSTPSTTRSLVTGLAQLVIGLAALAWTWNAWSAWDEGTNRSAGWALSLALLCLSLAVINLLLPIVAPLLSRPGHGSLLPVRLPAQFDESANLSIPLMGLAFGITAIPLWVIVLAAPGDSIEQFVALGFGLITTVLAVILLAISARQVYIMLSAQRLEIEIETRQLLPGQSVACFILGQRGRLPVQRISLYLICRRTSRPQSGSQPLITEFLHQELLYEVPAHELEADMWRKHLTLSIPGDTHPSLMSWYYPVTRWDLQARVQLAGFPDYSEYFPIEVLPLEEDGSALEEGEPG